MIRRILSFCALGCMAILLLGCTVHYSFTGASIAPEVQTVSIENFPNLAPLVNPTLAATFTEKLKDRFMTQTRLNIVQQNGDFHFSGEITGYSIAPTAIQGNEQAAMNRFTITIHAIFTNTTDEKASYDRSFSAYEDFSANQAFPSVEQQLTESICDKLVEDIFNAAVANW